MAKQVAGVIESREPRHAPMMADPTRPGSRHGVAALPPCILDIGITARLLSALTSCVPWKRWKAVHHASVAPLMPRLLSLSAASPHRQSHRSHSQGRAQPRSPANAPRQRRHSFGIMHMQQLRPDEESHNTQVATSHTLSVRYVFLVLYNTQLQRPEANAPQVRAMPRLYGTVKPTPQCMVLATYWPR